MEKVVFIDRDGVINKDLCRYVENSAEFEFLPGVLDALKLLTENSYKIIIISNQAGIGDGRFSKDALDEINMYWESKVNQYGAKIEKMFYCLHGKFDGCKCRKPEIGLFLEAEQYLGKFDKKITYFIGDKLTDIVAGNTYGIKTILVKTGYGLKDMSNIDYSNKPTYIENDLLSAVKNMVLK